jgi:hypothetical protein
MRRREHERRPQVGMVATAATDPVKTARDAMRNLTPEQRRAIVDEFFVLAGVLRQRADSRLKSSDGHATIPPASPEAHDSSSAGR